MAPVTSSAVPRPLAAPPGDAPSVAGVTSNPATFLKVGSSGPGVAALQTLLKRAGFDPRSGTPPDGQFGEKTMQALKAFQAARGLTRDGVVGPETKAVLLSLKPVASTSPAKATPLTSKSGDGFEVVKKAPVAIKAAQPMPQGDVISTARSELGKNATEVKLGSDTIGQAMRDDVSSWKCCANFVGASLYAAGQITEKDLSASVDGLMGKLRKTGNYTESHSLNTVQAGDVVAFDHAHVMLCTGRDPKTNQPLFIGSNNDNKDGSQKISEGPLTKWFAPNSKMLKAWQDNVVVMHRSPPS